MKKMIYAVEYHSTSKGAIETKRIELGEAYFDEDNRIANSKHDELKKKAFKLIKSRQAHHIRLETADGAYSKFGGYPAVGSEWDRIPFRKE